MTFFNFFFSTVPACTTKWRNLVSAFHREMRSIEKYDPNQNYNKDMKLYTHMQFIEGTPPETTTNNSKLNSFNIESDIENSDEEVEIVIEDSEIEFIENSTDENEDKTCSKHNESSVSSDIQIDAVGEELPDIKIENNPIYDVDTHSLEKIVGINTENSAIIGQISSSNNKIKQEQIMLPDAVIKEEIEDEVYQNANAFSLKNQNPEEFMDNEEIITSANKKNSNSTSQLQPIDNLHIKIELENTELQKNGENTIQIMEEFLENEQGKDSPKRPHQVDKNSTTKPISTTSNVSHMQMFLQENNVNSSATKDVDDLDFLVAYLPQMKRMSKFQNLVFRAKMSDLIMNIINSGEMDKSDNTSALEEKVRDIRSRAIADIEDPNCIFLVSFLPYIQFMHRLQNLEFRGKINDLVQNILST